MRLIKDRQPARPIMSQIMANSSKSLFSFLFKESIYEKNFRVLKSYRRSEVFLVCSPFNCLLLMLILKTGPPEGFHIGALPKGRHVFQRDQIAVSVTLSVSSSYFFSGSFYSTHPKFKQSRVWFCGMQPVPLVSEILRKLQ